METYKYDFRIRRGETFSRDIALTDAQGEVITLYGKTAKGQMRPSVGEKTLAAEFQTLVNSSGGIVTISLTHSQTKDIPEGEYDYDLAVYNSLDVDFVLEGKFTVIEPTTEISFEATEQENNTIDDDEIIDVVDTGEPTEELNEEEYNGE